jgi:hypothetical protein
MTPSRWAPLWSSSPELQHLGIGLVSLREALDLTSPIGRAMYALVGVLAEVERAWIVERTHAGLRRAQAQGKRLGRPAVITDSARLRAVLASGASYRAAAPSARRVGRDRPADCPQRCRPCVTVSAGPPRHAGAMPRTALIPTTEPCYPLPRGLGNRTDR